MCLQSCMRSNLTVILFILSFIKISNTLVSNGMTNGETESCIFPISNNEVIDLSPLAESTEPMTVSTRTSLYIYHPCKDVPLNTKLSNECRNKYRLCYFVPNKPTNKTIDFYKVLLNEIPGNFTLLAVNGESVFLNVMNEPEIVYVHLFNNTLYSSYIQLVCDESIENYKLVVVTTLAHVHVLSLYSKYACVRTVHYMSGGAVFFIILVVFIILYFVGGILVLKFIRGATGIEMIPNHEFWCNLPQTAKDGFKYLTNCGTVASDSYEKI